MHVRMLSLRRPGLPVWWCVNFVEAIQDPWHLFKVKRPECKLFEAIIDESSDLLTTCSAVVQLGSREAQHCFVDRCKNKKNPGHSGISLSTGEQDKHNSDELNSSR